MKRFTFLLAAVMAATTIFGQNTGSLNEASTATGNTVMVKKWGTQYLNAFLYLIQDENAGTETLRQNTGSLMDVESYALGSVKYLEALESGEHFGWYAVEKELKQVGVTGLSTVLTAPTGIHNTIGRLTNGNYVFVEGDATGTYGHLFISDELGGSSLTGAILERPTFNSKMAIVGNKVYFEGQNGNFGQNDNIWSVDLTDVTNPVKVKHTFNTSMSAPSWLPNEPGNEFLTLGDKVFFYYNHFDGWQKLTEVTELGTQDYKVGSDWNYNVDRTAGIIENNGKLFVVAATSANTSVKKLYAVSDAFASVAIDVNGADVSDEVESLVISGTNLYFFATDATEGKGLYVVDLTAGTLSATRLFDAAEGDHLTAIEFSDSEVIFTTGSETNQTVHTSNGSDVFTLTMDASYNGNVGAILNHGNVLIFHHDGTQNQVSQLQSIPSIPTSLEAATEAKVTVGPNPASDILRIAGETVTNVEVYNLAGAIVLSETGSNITTVNMGGLSSGLYIVNVTSVEGATKTVKITKR